MAERVQRSGEGLFAIAFYSSFLLKTEAKMTRATSASAGAYKWESKMSFVSRSLCGISHNNRDFRTFSKRATLSSSNLWTLSKRTRWRSPLGPRAAVLIPNVRYHAKGGLPTNAKFLVGGLPTSAVDCYRPFTQHNMQNQHV